MIGKGENELQDRYPLVFSTLPISPPFPRPLLLPLRTVAVQQATKIQNKNIKQFVPFTCASTTNT